MARVHIGGGRTGFSTGVGPLSFYQSMGRPRSGGRPSGGAGRGSSLSLADERRLVAQARAAERAEEITALQHAIERIRTMHLVDFPPALPPTAREQPVVDLATLIGEYERAALTQTSILRRQDRAERRERKAAAVAMARRDHAAMVETARAQHLEDQQVLDRLWALLCANDPDVVLATLEAAFMDNEAPAVAVGVDAQEVTILLLAPTLDAIPERRPAVTGTGRPTMARMTKAERHELYAALVCGHVLLTVKETLAVAPGTSSVRVVAMRREGMDAYGRDRMECILAGTWQRSRFEGVQWGMVDAVVIAHDCATELIVNARSGNELRPIDTSSEPDIQAVLDSVAFEADPPGAAEVALMGPGTLGPGSMGPGSIGPGR